MNREEIIELLKEVLEFDVRTSEHYTGGMDGGPMYTRSTTLTVKIDGDVVYEGGV